MATALRLNNRIRDELYSYALTLIKFPEDDKAADEAVALAEKLVREVMANRYPAEDLVVLEKYECLNTTDCIHFTNGVMDRHFRFPHDTEMPKVVNNHRYQPAIMVGDVVMEAIENADHTREQRKKHRQQLEVDYRRLIDAAHTFEELLEVWPEASVMREKIDVRVQKNALTCISAEALERIKADVASRATKD